MSSLPSPVLVGSDYSSDYRFRVRYGDHIKHLLVKEGSLTGDEQCVPPFALPSLPYGEDTWNVAELSREGATGEWQIGLSRQKLPGVHQQWWAEMVDCIHVERIWQLSLFAMTCRRTDRPELPPMVAKIANILGGAMSRR